MLPSREKKIKVKKWGPYSEKKQGETEPEKGWKKRLPGFLP